LSVGKGYFWKVRSSDGSGNTSYYSGTGQFKISSTTAVEKTATIPTQFDLSQNYPNPFNPTTVINYSLPNNAFVVLKIYDMLGREIRTLVNNEMNAGKYSISWKGEDNNGNKVTSGIYIYKISAGNYSAARKMVVLK
jgi:flagellar hook assembly protein FlgD